MTLNSYQSQQLIDLLETLQSKQASGTLYLDAQINSEQKKRSRILIWQEGRIAYGGINVPDAQSLVKMLQQKLNREWVDSAVNFAMRQTTNQTSIRAFLERLVDMQLFTWEQIETVFRNQIVLTLEQVLPYAGQFEFDSRGQFNICRGLELSKLMQDLAHRQERWLSIQSFIPSMDAVPHLKTNILETIAEPAVRQHLNETVNGERSLVEIAEILDKDPLVVAQSYLQWVQANWVEMEGNTLLSTTIIKTSVPTVLAVDDSTVMQKVIKRSLDGYCRVLVASNATDALNLLNQENISLLLLDVSMPEIDGLEVCRIVRNMPQFRDLPIIMVTGKDGFFDKVKGRIAGSTEYLTKPFDADELRGIVGQYINPSVAI